MDRLTDVEKQLDSRLTLERVGNVLFCSFNAAENDAPAHGCNCFRKFMRLFRSTFLVLCSEVSNATNVFVFYREFEKRM